MRILVLTPYLYGTTPGPRSSIELWERVLAPAGITFHYAPFEDERLRGVIYEQGRYLPKVAEITRCYARRFGSMRGLRDYDAVLVYREAALIGPEVFERWVSRRGLPIIYQLDDPLYVPYRSPSNGYLSYLKSFGKVGRIAGMSKLTIVNSRQHQQYVEQFTDRVRLIPILVDGDEYTPREPDPNSENVCVGWTGSATTAPNLREIEGSLQRLSRRDDVELRFIGGEGGHGLHGVQFVARPWSAATELEELRRFDIGLLPLPYDGWTTKKFYMKLIQYMALGIPPICTPLGANPEVVEHGRNGFLATSAADWDDALRTLIEDAELRRRVGAAAAATAHANYTVQARADDILEAFDAALRS